MLEIIEPVETREDLRARLARDVMQIRDQLSRLPGVPLDELIIESAAWKLAHVLAHLLDEGVAPEDAEGWRYNAQSLALIVQMVPFLRRATESK